MAKKRIAKRRQFPQPKKRNYPATAGGPIVQDVQSVSDVFQGPPKIADVDGALPPQSVPVSPEPSARTAPTPVSLEIGPDGTTAEARLEGAGRSTADADIRRARSEPQLIIRTITDNLRANPIGNRDIAHSLFDATQAQLSELKEAGSNDPETRDLIDFLAWLAEGLERLTQNLSLAISQPDQEPMFNGLAGQIAYQLKTGLLEAVEKKRVRIWEYGGAVGTASFLWWLSGEKLTELLGILFKKK